MAHYRLALLRRRRARGARRHRCVRRAAAPAVALHLDREPARAPAVCRPGVGADARARGVSRRVCEVVGGCGRYSVSCGPGGCADAGWGEVWGYTAQCNLLDYPAVVFPVDMVDVGVDGVEEYVPRNREDRMNYESYSPEKYASAPISLQLVGQRYEDEKVLEALEYIQGRLGCRLRSSYETALHGMYANTELEVVVAWKVSINDLGLANIRSRERVARLYQYPNTQL